MLPFLPMLSQYWESIGVYQCFPNIGKVLAKKLLYQWFSYIGKTLANYMFL
jgi:hypothetical protein